MTPYRSSDHGCMWLLIFQMLFYTILAPPQIYYTLVQSSVSTTGGLQIFFFNSTLYIEVKNTSLHMWAKLGGCPSHTESIRKVISLFSFFFKIKMENTTSTLKVLFKAEKWEREEGTGERRVLKGRCFIWKDREQVFFSLRGVEGSPGSFFSLWGCSVMCNSLQLFAQWRENIQSFHPWLRHHGLDRPHSLCFSQSLSNSWAKVKWELHLRQPRLSDCECLH